MDFLTLAQTRYSTKKYNPAKTLSEEQLQQLQEILHLSPSSINGQPWKFTFVTSETTKNELAGVSFFNEPKIKDAPLLVVFSAADDLQLFEEQITRYLPEGAVGYYQQFVKPLPEADIKSWLQNQVYLALGFFLAACAGLQLDATPMEGIKGPEYDRILNLKGYKTLAAVAVGYRDETDANQPALRPKSRIPKDLVIQTV